MVAVREKSSILRLFYKYNITGSIPNRSKNFKINLQNNNNNGSPLQELTTSGSERSSARGPDHFNNKQPWLDYELRPRTQEKKPHGILTSKIHSYISTFNINTLIQSSPIQWPSQVSRTHYHGKKFMDISANLRTYKKRLE